MGHMWAEMFPDQAEAQAKFYARRNKIMKQLKNIPLGMFTTHELIPLIRLLGRSLDLEQNDMVILSKALKRIHEK